jgi:ethanolamine ammonia-lyase large subunit
MLNYQSTSFHDALYLRQTLGLLPAPEFEAWLQSMALMDDKGAIRDLTQSHHPLLAIGRGLP